MYFSFNFTCKKTTPDFNYWPEQGSKLIITAVAVSKNNKIKII